MAVTDFTTADTTLCLGLTGREGREVVVQQEAHVALVQHVVHHLLVKLGAKCGCAQRLSLTTGEDSTSVRHGQSTYLAPDGTDVSGLAAVQTNTLVQDTATHCILLHVMIVTVYQSVLLCQFVIAQFGVCSSILQLEVLADLLKSLGTRMLLQCLLGNVVSGLVASGLHQLAQFLVVNLMAVLTLHVGTKFLGQFLLQLAHGLDSLMGSLQGAKQILLANLLHLALNHHDILLGSTYHQVHISLLQLCKGGVDNVFSVDTCHTNLTDGAIKRYVAAAQCSTGGKTCQCIGHIHAICRIKDYIHINLCMVIAGEQRTQGTVNQTTCQNLVVICLTLALCKTAGKTSGCTVLFTILYLQRHKICAGNSILGTANSGQEHGIVHAQHHGTIGLFCQLSGLNADGTSVRQRHSLCNYIHLLVSYCLYKTSISMQRYKKEPYTLLYICTINLKKVKNEQIRPIIVVYSFLCYTFATQF